MAENSPAPRGVLWDFRWDHLSPEQNRLLRALRAHTGAAEAMSVPDAAKAAGLSDRRAQEVVKELIEGHGVPIGSSSSSTRPGWYLCMNEAERASNREALRHRALSILRRAKAFDPRNNTRLAELFGAQEPLFPGASPGGAR